MELTKDIDPSNPAQLQQWISEVSRLFGLFGPIRHLYHAEKTIDFGSISTNDFATDTITVTGVKTSLANSVLVGYDSPPTDGISFDAYVSADDTVTIRAINLTTGSIDPASNTYQITVFEYD